MCLRGSTLTEEHLIPEALGGLLTADLLCRKCNSSLGHRAEAAARSDPSIRLLINDLSAQLPSLAQTLTERQPFFSHGPGGKAKGYVKNGEFAVQATKNPDGSLIQSTPEASRTIDTILRREGYDAPFRSAALRKLDQTPENVRITVAAGLEVVKWQVMQLELALDGPFMDFVVPVKTAFEFLACHLGTVIYEQEPRLDEARRVLQGGDLDLSWISVERLHAEKASPFHGIAFEGNTPHATVQIRLFGKLAFRVHFLHLSVGGPRFLYTHDLVSNEEHLFQINENRVE